MKLTPNQFVRLRTACNNDHGKVIQAQGVADLLGRSVGYGWYLVQVRDKVYSEYEAQGLR